MSPAEAIQLAAVAPLVVGQVVLETRERQALLFGYILQRAPLQLGQRDNLRNEVIRDLIKTEGTLSDNWSALGGLTLYGVAIISIAALTLREPD